MFATLLLPNSDLIIFADIELWIYNTVQICMQHSVYSGIHYFMQADTLYK